MLIKCMIYSFIVNHTLTSLETEFIHKLKIQHKIKKKKKMI